MCDAWWSSPRWNLSICFLNAFAWIFFRANTLSDVTYIITHLSSGWNEPLNFSQTAFRLNTNTLQVEPSEFIISIALILLIGIYQFIQEHTDTQDTMIQWPWWIRWSIYVGICLMIMNIGIAKELPFIYFQF